MIVLDTHVLVWLAVDPGRISAAARGAIEMDGGPAISTVTCQEISYLVMRGRIGLDRPVRAWLADVLAEHGIEALAPTWQVATRAGAFPEDEFPGDPADRLIYATAVEHGVRLVTADRRLREVDPARVVW